jgi:hypothetical protein
MNDLKTYVFDLDNTLCKTEGSNYLDAVPFTDRIKKVNLLHDAGHTIIIETARGCVSGKKWFIQTMEQIKSWGLKFDTLRAGIKFSADFYVDDKGINSEDFFNDTRKLNLESGSGTQTNVVIVSRVLKEATNERMDKLIDEINFIDNIPEPFKEKFPKIVFSKKEKDKVFYEMQHYQLPSIRRLILSNEFGSDDIADWSKKITNFSLSMYRHEILDISKQTALQKLHWERFDNRMFELSNKSEWFKRTLRQQKIIINNKEYYNINFMYDKIRQKESWFYPEFVGRWSHSDLHFSNILVDLHNNDFVLVDPRGYQFCDYYYDFGKIWHSVEGKYELIADGLFEVSNISKGNYFEINKNNAYNSLEGAKQSIMNMFCDLSSESNDNVILKTEFNNVMHFATLIPFLLEFDNEETRARASYYQSVVLMNEFCKKHGLI